MNLVCFFLHSSVFYLPQICLPNPDNKILQKSYYPQGTVSLSSHIRYHCKTVTDAVLTVIINNKASFLPKQWCLLQVYEHLLLIRFILSPFLKQSSYVNKFISLQRKSVAEPNSFKGSVRRSKEIHFFVTFIFFIHSLFFSSCLKGTCQFKRDHIFFSYRYFYYDTSS